MNSVRVISTMHEPNTDGVGWAQKEPILAEANNGAGSAGSVPPARTGRGRWGTWIVHSCRPPCPFRASPPQAGGTEGGILHVARTFVHRVFSSNKLPASFCKRAGRQLLCANRRSISPSVKVTPVGASRWARKALASAGLNGPRVLTAKTL